MATLRFAPSPTGRLHLGGLRMALINHLIARKLNGKWILRVEDTDQKRLIPGSVDDIKTSLAWAGLNYDYGPGRNGPHGPYTQSERLDLYKTHAKHLLESGHAYRCFCDTARLIETKERLQRAGSNATYDRACLHLSEEEATRRVKAGEKHVIRINDDLGRGEGFSTTDLIFGKTPEMASSQATDSILVKTDAFPTYHFASVVDDHHMSITHVVRGEEWLPSLPLHLQLYKALSWEPPKFAHIPLLLNPDGSKMSKRKGDAHVGDYIAKGWEPEAVLNWLALAGWNRDSQSSDSFILSLRDMENQFDLSNLTHRRNILTPTMLGYLNRHHLKRNLDNPSSSPDLVDRALTNLSSSFSQSSFIDRQYVERALPPILEKLDNLSEVPSYAPYLFLTEEDFEVQRAPPSTRKSLTSDKQAELAQATRQALSEETLAQPETVKRLVDLVRTEQKVSQGDLMYTLRMALSGTMVGPSVVDIIMILGKERTLSRLESFKVA